MSDRGGELTVCCPVCPSTTPPLMLDEGEATCAECSFSVRGEPWAIAKAIAAAVPAKVGSTDSSVQASGPLEQLHARRVVQSAPPPKPVIIYRLADQQVCTAGNLTVVSGQSKSGKSAATAAMIASPFGPAGERDFLGFTGEPAGDKPVLVFDTEQSPYDAWQLQCRVLGRAGLTRQPASLQHFYMLDMTVEDRREAFFAECMAAAGRGQVHSIFLDGVADIADDPNDPAESFALVARLVKLSVDCHCPVILVLHENPAMPGASGKTRGHLGSHLERKAETNLRIVKDEDNISVIYSERSRNAAIPKHMGPRFEWSDELRMHVSAEAASEVRSRKERGALDLELSRVFAGGEKTWSEAASGLAQFRNITFDAGKKRLRYLTERGEITKTESGNYTISSRGGTR